MRRLAAWIAAVALVASVALPVGASARVPGASLSANCAAETKRLKAFKKKMPAAKRRFFRTHKRAKARKAFVKAQKRRLAKLKKARKRCLARLPGVTPPAAPAAPAAPPPPGPGPSPAPTATPTPTPTPQGNPPATDVIEDVVSSAARFEPHEVSTEDGVEYVRTQLELELAPDATKEQMDALLDRLDAVVVSSLEGVGILTVRIPDPGTLTALRELVADLAGAPGLARADLATVPVTTELPDIQPADAGLLRPQLGSRAAAMWNARAALEGASAPTLVITDYFGAGPPGPEAAVQETAADFATGNVHPHGYTMLGLAAGTFESGAVANLDVDRVAGMWAGPDLPLRVVDLRNRIAGSTLEDRTLLLVDSLPGDVVVSTSLAAGCAPAVCTDEEIRADALQWIQRVRGRGLEGRFLHVVAAGNIYSDHPNDTQARRGSAFVAAAITPLPVANLTNTIAVENTTASDGTAGPIEPVCLTATSKRGGHVSAVGNDIRSFGAPGVFRNLPEGGTSSAAPQVAGTASTVWTLAPSLSASGVVGILRTTARPVDDVGGDPRCGDAPAAPALDAHAAVLAADGAVNLPARSAILDADEDEQFDEQDLAAFRDAFAASGSDGATDLDYGRHDLNGDGYTGGGRDRYELDASSPPEWTFSRRREVLGLEILHDERSVRDLDILCHEAHGPAYDGDPAARDTFAAQHCVPPVEISVDPAFPTVLGPGGSAQLRVRARRTDLTDATVSHQPGVRLEYTVSGGTVGAVTAVTGQDGAFSTSATRTDASAPLTVTVVARAGQGGPELDRLTVTAGDAVGAIVLERRVSSVRGQCSATAHSVPPVGDSVDELTRSDELVTGTFAETATASTSANGTSDFPGNSASCTGTGTQTDALAMDGSSLSLTFDGSTSGNGTASFNGDHGASSGTGVGNALALVNFRVEGAPVTYELEGEFSNGLGGSGGSSYQQTVQFGRRFPSGQFTQLAGVERTGDHNNPGSAAGTVSGSGTLQPGKYEFFVSLGCSASGFGTTSGSGPNASCGTGGGLTLEVGP